MKHRNDDFLSDVALRDGADVRRSNYPQASVILPTSDAYRGGYFPELLRQLAEQSFQNFEVIIVKGDPRQGRAINVGAGMARGNTLITLDDDVRLGHRDVFRNLMDALEQHEDIGMAGVSNVVPRDAPWLVRRAMLEIPRRHSPLVERITDSDLAEHPCCAIPKRVFHEIGGENELIPRGLDPYLRSEIRKAGYRVVVIPGTWVHHLPPASYRALLRQFFRNGRQAAYCNRHYPQWVIETPDQHVGVFQERVPLPWRLLRYGARISKSLIFFRWIHLSAQCSYAAGFLSEYAQSRGMAS